MDPGLTLGFTSLEEDIRNDLVDLTDQLEQWVIGQVLEGEFTLGSVSRVLRVKKVYLGWENRLQSFGGRRGRNRGRLGRP